MPSVGTLRFHDYQFQYQTPMGVWRWTTRIDTSLSTPSYQVRDIISPFGLLRDSIPLPGEVVKSMADSVTEVQQNFAPSILVGPPSSLTFTVDEGRGLSAAQTFIVTNSGVYGSILDATAVPSAAYLRTSPTHVGGLAKNSTGTFSVSVDSTSLLATSSPYSAAVTLQDPTAGNTPQTLPVTINVRPKATITLVPTTLTFNVVRPVSGPYPAIPTQTFDVQNTGLGGSVLDYLIQKLVGLSDWLVSFTPTEGTLAGGASQTVTVTVAPPASMLWGTYTETLRVSGYSSNSYQDIVVQLVIS